MFFYGRYSIMAQIDDLSENVNAMTLLKKVKAFKTSSEQGKYYQKTDQKAQSNHREPIKTIEWHNTLSELLAATHRLSEEGWYQTAVDCYHRLFECIEMAFDEEEDNFLVIYKRDRFLDELNDLQREEIESYIICLAKTATPYEYADCLIPFVVADYPCCEDRVYEIAIREASAAQRLELDQQIEKREVKITMEGEYYGDFDY